MSLDIVPVSLREANAFVERYHRHHRPVVGHKFSIGATDGENIVGVCIVGRPVSRYLDDGMTLEVTRCCTDGTHNACSILYGAAGERHGLWDIKKSSLIFSNQRTAQASKRAGISVSENVAGLDGQENESQKLIYVPHN